MNLPTDQSPPVRRKKNYKLIVDPALKQGLHKVFRVEGVIQGSKCPSSPVIIQDPRVGGSRLWGDVHPANDFKHPKFRINVLDLILKKEIAEIPCREVTLTNLNDNCDVKFLRDICSSFGEIEYVKIYRNPHTERHLGVGKIVYKEAVSAKRCIDSVDNTPRMGNVVSVMPDTFGRKRARIIKDLVNSSNNARNDCNNFDKGQENSKTADVHVHIVESDQNKRQSEMYAETVPNNHKIAEHSPDPYLNKMKIDYKSSESGRTIHKTDKKVSDRRKHRSDKRNTKHDRYKHKHDRNKHRSDMKTRESDRNKRKSDKKSSEFDRNKHKSDRKLSQSDRNKPKTDSIQSDSDRIKHNSDIPMSIEKAEDKREKISFSIKRTTIIGKNTLSPGPPIIEDPPEVVKTAVTDSVVNELKVSLHTNIVNILLRDVVLPLIDNWFNSNKDKKHVWTTLETAPLICKRKGSERRRRSLKRRPGDSSGYRSRHHGSRRSRDRSHRERGRHSRDRHRKRGDKTRSNSATKRRDRRHGGKRTRCPHAADTTGVLAVKELIQMAETADSNLIDDSTSKCQMVNNGDVEPTIYDEVIGNIPVEDTGLLENKQIVEIPEVEITENEENTEFEITGDLDNVPQLGVNDDDQFYASQQLIQGYSITEDLSILENKQILQLLDLKEAPLRQENREDPWAVRETSPAPVAPGTTGSLGSRKMHVEYFSSSPEREPSPPRNIYTIRSQTAEHSILTEYLTRGISKEDINYLKMAYQQMLSSDDPPTWAFSSHWIDHCPTRLPSPDKNSNLTGGCCRTMDITSLKKLKRGDKYSNADRPSKLNHSSVKTQGITMGGYSLANGQSQCNVRTSALADHRRLCNDLAGWGTGVSDKVKFNNLKFRKKLLKFRKSSIHSWGLFANEDIPSDDLVIEYVGCYIRMSVAEVREKQYFARGEGSSYLFKVDDFDCIDATMMGNLARFINHSCNPSCCARVVELDGHKKVCIYSKRDIPCGEEVTYDYKFSAEEGDKIPCHCGAHNCRQYLN